MTPEQFSALVDRCIAAKAHAPMSAPAGLELDLPENVFRGEQWLATQPPPVDGTASDTLYTQAAWLKDYGLSRNCILDMLGRHSPGYLNDDIATRIANAFKHGQNEQGARATSYGVASVEIAPPPPPIDSTVRPWAYVRALPPDSTEWWWTDRCVLGDANLYTGRPKVGKTTLIENLAVAVVGKANLLGKEVRQGPVFMLVGEDRYAQVRDNLAAIRDSLKVHDKALEQNLTLFSIRSDRIKEGHRLAEIDDAGVVCHSRFLVEVVMPHLISLPKPCLWIIDPVAVFFGFNRYSDTAARALVDGFLNDIVDMGITPLLTDHPSQASLDDGRNVAGSVQLAAAFPLVATLKGDKWQGSVQRPMSFEIMGSRYGAGAPDGDVNFYRLKSSPAFSLHGALGHSRQDYQLKVFDYIMTGWREGRRYTNQNGASIDGPAGLAQLLIMDEVDVKAALFACLRDGWLEKTEGTRPTVNGVKNMPHHLRPGARQPIRDPAEASATGP